jgi:hypothetical protein
MLGQPGAHLFSGWAGIAVQKCFGRNHHTRCAETALSRAMHSKGHLDRVHFFGCADALNGDHIGAVFHFAHFNQA